MLKLYYSPGSCSLAAHIALEEIGQPYELELVSAAGEHEGEMTATAKWRAVNPKARVPVLGGVPGQIAGSPDVLTEVPAILFYLARSNPDACLMPRTPASEARCLEWMNYLSSSVHATAYAQIWRPLRFVSDQEAFGPLKAKGVDSVRDQYSYIESILTDGREWAVPESYSIADAYLLVFYRWGSRIGLDMRNSFPGWTELAERVTRRAAVQRVFQRERISLY
ncbi:glutathione S-transferase family protein [Bradyrhizobium sp. USDA 4461]